ncbi:MAG: hypothetical protein IKM64_09090, partial [Clostridia bacterium]|nr:hypothetical protein [Clostridia bacterium]
KTKKHGGEFILFHAFFMFSLRPWGLLRSCLSVMHVGKQISLLVPFSVIFSSFGRKLFVCQINPFAYWVQGQCPWRRGTGDEQSPASFLSNRRKKAAENIRRHGILSRCISRFRHRQA